MSADGNTLKTVKTTFAILMGVFALFGAQTVHWGQQPITGVAGLLASPLIGLMLAVVFSFFGWLSFMFSFWLFSRFGSLTIEYITDEPPPGASAE